LVVGWLIVTGRPRPSPDYLVACRPYLGEVAARHHRAFYERFAATPPVGERQGALDCQRQAGPFPGPTRVKNMRATEVTG
jgi:hypothetical protein